MIRLYSPVKRPLNTTQLGQENRVKRGNKKRTRVRTYYQLLKNDKKTNTYFCTIHCYNNILSYIIVHRTYTNRRHLAPPPGRIYKFIVRDDHVVYETLRTFSLPFWLHNSTSTTTTNVQVRARQVHGTTHDWPGTPTILQYWVVGDIFC